ncbi:MAG: efflux RND transporter periplasmic adaptor subunit [bacterium]|nr:efflux RND transporter periplasmic adaptor subunit [bacterium]
MRSSRKLLWLLIAVICCAGLAMSLTWGTRGADPNTVIDDFPIEVTLRDISSAVLATGIIKPSIGAEVKVGSRVSGVVARLHVEIGDKVEQGQLLGELDPTEYEARCRQAQASLENARAELTFRRLELERQEALFEGGFTSGRQLDEARARFDLAQASVKEAQARLAYDEVQLAYTRISAPISGVIAAVSTQEGETVAASLAAPTFVVLIDLDRLEVWAYVDETDIGRIQEGQRATFTVDTYPDVDFGGVVTAIYPKAEMKDNVVNYVTIINIDDGTGTFRSGEARTVLRPEMTTTCRIYQETRGEIATLPSTVVHRDGAQRFVYLAEGEASTRHNVTVGWSDGSIVEITSGLTAGQHVLSEPRKELDQ